MRVSLKLDADTNRDRARIGWCSQADLTRSILHTLSHTSSHLNSLTHHL